MCELSKKQLNDLKDILMGLSNNNSLKKSIQQKIYDISNNNVVRK